MEREGRARRALDGRWALTPAGRECLAKAPANAAVSRAPVPYDADGLPVVDDPGPPDDGPAGTLSLDPSQVPVVRAQASARQIVRAGPGFGKTAVLCARVAWLLDQGLNPPNILVLSFTRTAVRELRTRVRDLAHHGVDVAGVEIRTLDSWAWGLRTAVGDPRAASYEESIQLTANLLGAPSGELAGHLHAYEHVFVDEAQDLVGARASLVFRLLAALSPGCGYTVFLDPAQAIYDWSDEETETHTRANSFQAMVPSLAPAPNECELHVLHRTRDPGLRRLLLGARALVLEGAVTEPLPRLRRVLEARSLGEVTNGHGIAELASGVKADSLILFRRRAEVLEASSWLASLDPPLHHRLRFGALPPVVAPWIALLVHDAYTLTHQPVLPKARLAEAWGGLKGTRHGASLTFDQVYRALRRMGHGHPKDAIDVRRVRGALATRRVPDEVMLKEIGPGGPIIGTIHGSKGREADEVVFFIPELREREVPDLVADEQEARVLYVGVSRAKERLEIRREKAMWYSCLQSGRIWHRHGGKAFRVEVGREGDIDPVAGLVAGGARQQAWLREYDGTIRTITGLLVPENQWRWELRDSSGMAGGQPLVLGVLSPGVGRDIRLAASGGEKVGYTNDELRYVRVMDVTTVAMPPESEHPERQALPEPWRTLGIWLAPLVVGLGRTFSRYGFN